MEDDQDIPTQAEQALYLVTELSWLMDRTSPEDWPQHQANLFRRRLREIGARSGLDCRETIAG
jgi:hypothetical protein